MNRIQLKINLNRYIFVNKNQLSYWWTLIETYYHVIIYYIIQIVLLGKLHITNVMKYVL